MRESLNDGHNRYRRIRQTTLQGHDCRPGAAADSRLRQTLISAAAPLGAFVFSLIASAIVLIAVGSNPIEASPRHVRTRQQT